MDIFDNDGNYIRSYGNSQQDNDDGFMDLAKYLQGPVGEDSSLPERFLDNSIGTGQKTLTLIYLGIGILTLLIFLTPFFRFVIELASWTDNQVWELFH